MCRQTIYSFVQRKHRHFLHSMATANANLGLVGPNRTQNKMRPTASYGWNQACIISHLDAVNVAYERLFGAHFLQQGTLYKQMTCARQVQTIK